MVVDPKAESMSLDLQADPGKSVTVEVVGPDGAPIGGTKAKGVGETVPDEPHPPVVVQLRGPRPRPFANRAGWSSCTKAAS